MSAYLAQIVPQLQPVVEMRDLSIQWGPRPVLNRVSLTLHAGERLAVVGPSGAGKSTVLRLLAGLQLPTSGELRLFNKPQTYLRLDQTNPPDVRLVFQNPLFWHRSPLRRTSASCCGNGRNCRGRRFVIACIDAWRRLGSMKWPTSMPVN